MNIRTLTFLLASFFFSYSFAQTTVPALILSDQVWTAAGSPYLISQNTYIDSGITVTMMPGSELIGSGSYRRLDIDGALNILGNRDSLVMVSGIQLVYSATSAEYHRAIGKTAIVNYADVKGTGVANRVFDLKGGIDFTFTNTKIDSGYYDIQYQPDYNLLGTLTIDSCELYGVHNTTYYQGSVIYVLGSGNLNLNITNSTIGLGRSLYLDGKLNIEGCTFTGLNNIYFGATKDKPKVIECNTFIECGEAKIALDGNTSSDIFQFTNNTFDTSGHTELNLSYTSNSSFSISPTIIRNNNFTGQGRNVRVYGSNPKPTTYLSLDLMQNYWGTVDTPAIKDKITDYSDDINIYGKVDFYSYLSALVTGCPNINPCPTPNFSFSRDDDFVTVYDSTDASASIMRIWSFGEGTLDTTYGDSFTYAYSNSGTYSICLYTVDQAGNICDSMCQSVTIPALLTCNSSFYVAVDTSIAFNLFIVEDCENTTSTTVYTWDFGDGSSSSLNLPTHEYDNFGKYNLCLTISDPANNCLSEFCDSIGMDATGAALKTDNFTIRVVKVTNSINELKSEDIKLYPNPTKDMLTIQVDVQVSQDYQYTVVNSLGEQVQAMDQKMMLGEQRVSLDLSDQPAGMYFVKVQTVNGLVTKKIFLTK